MAIRTDKAASETPRTRRERLTPFLADESGIKALESFIGDDNRMGREGMYTLEILYNLIKNYGKQNLFRRIPQEVFGGLSEGGRKNVQASLIGRAIHGAGTREPWTVTEGSGYRKDQEVIKRWAERDGSWSDTPDRDLEGRGYAHKSVLDGSEAHVFFPKGKDRGRLCKTIDMNHIDALEQMLDRIAIWNAAFPDTAIRIEGFGLRDDAIKMDDRLLTSNDFVLTVSQNIIEGRRPTQEEIDDAMRMRMFDKSASGAFWVQQLGNIVLADINEDNSRVSAEGLLHVFDGEAYLKFFPTDTVTPTRTSFSELQGYDSEQWKQLLGPEYLTTSEEQKSKIIKMLRMTGVYKGTVNGNVITLENPIHRHQNVNGTNVEYFDGAILYGPPDAFRKEKTYQIPELKYDPAAVEEIRKTVHSLVPQVRDLEEFLYDERFVGRETAQYKGGGDLRKFYKNSLKENGYYGGLVNDRFFVQLDAENPSRVLINDKENVAFMLWAGSREMPDGSKLTESEIKGILKGENIVRNGESFRYDIDRGRMVPSQLIQQKRRRTQTQSAAETRKKAEKTGIKTKISL